MKQKHPESGNPLVVRIWVHHKESIVRLTLRHGAKPIELYEGGQTDEGYAHRWELYEYDAQEGLVSYQVGTDCRDCDGRMTDDREFVWPVGGETEPCCTIGRSGEVVDLPEQRPVWTQARYRQRDYAAEAAGY